MPGSGCTKLVGLWELSVKRVSRMASPRSSLVGHTAGQTRWSKVIDGYFGPRGDINGAVYAVHSIAKSISRRSEVRYQNLRD